MTGVNFFITVLEGKRLGLLRALIPGIQLIAVLFNPDRPTHATEVREVQEAARAIGQQIRILLASNENAINAAFATATQLHAGAMLVGTDPFFNSQRDKIIALAARHSIPAIYEHARIRSGRRPDELRHQSYRWLSASRRLRREDSQG